MNPETLKLLQQIQMLVQQILEIEGRGQSQQAMPPEQMDEGALDRRINQVASKG